MKLIDADELIKNIPNEEMISKYAVAHAPSIDIVCCRDCKYGQDDLFHMFCAYHHHKTYADDFCNYGEREDE